MRFPDLFEGVEIIELPGFSDSCDLTPFERENLQRDYFADEVSKRSPTDAVVFFGDVDEIPPRSQIYCAKSISTEDECLSVPMIYSYRFANWLKDSDVGVWNYGKIFRGVLRKKICGGVSLETAKAPSEYIFHTWASPMI